MPEPVGRMTMSRRSIVEGVIALKPVRNLDRSPWRTTVVKLDRSFVPAAGTTLPHCSRQGRSLGRSPLFARRSASR
jgi:hypothetical protein